MLPSEGLARSIIEPMSSTGTTYLRPVPCCQGGSPIARACVKVPSRRVKRHASSTPTFNPHGWGSLAGVSGGFAASTLRSYRVGSRSSRIVYFFQHLRAGVLPHGWSQGLPGRSFGDHSPCYNKDNAPRKRVGSTSISGVACCKLLTLGALSDVSRAEITTYSVSIMPARSSNKRW